ncbi:hypothetical protein AZ09_05655 [Acetobacter aceti 1023]|nr:hypothetical protein AZ09_05655 [Acetobacter aceti 1023]
MVVTDTEAVASPREYRRLKLRGQAPQNTLDDMLKNEFKNLFMSDKIVAVNKKDANLLASYNFSNVRVLGHLQAPLFSSPMWEDRHNILFLGSLHDQESPNVDSLEWFTHAVLPLLEKRLPENVRLTICGYVSPRVDLTSLLQNRRVTVTGRVEDVTPIYNQHRVFIAPTRFAAGIPYKLHEAAAHGLPIVATNLLCEQVGWIPGEDMLCADISDAQAFADAIIRLYEDKDLWNSIHQHALERIRKENTKENYIETIKEIIEVS